jgi:GT2 family glycosyltransferase
MGSLDYTTGFSSALLHPERDPQGPAGQFAFTIYVRIVCREQYTEKLLMVAQNVPTFSVIVATHNRPQALVRCLRALAGSDLARSDFEVIVVNDGSSVDYEESLGEIRREFDFQYLTQKQGGPALARNTGLAIARGRYVAFTDDDCAPAPTWLSALKSCLALHPEAAVGGKTVNGLPANPYSEAHEMLMTYIADYQKRNLPGWSPFLAGNNFALSREQFVETGAFDQAWRYAAAEDREFFSRWLARGKEVVQTNEAINYHFHAMTFSSFLEVHSRYGSGARLLHRGSGRTGERLVRSGPFSFYWNLIFFPFGRCSMTKALKYSALLALAQAAHAFGYFRQIVARS